MANKVSPSPRLPLPISLTSIESISSFMTTFIQQSINELREHATRLNNVLVADGTEAARAPVILKTYIKTALPDAVKYVNGMIIVSNDVGGLTPAFSDGTNWRRVADRNIIS